LRYYSPEGEALRKRGYLYLEWRKKVFVLCGRACQGCGSKNRLQTHHILSWAKFPEKRFDPFNGRVLCFDCHKTIHPWLTEEFYKVKGKESRKKKKSYKSKKAKLKFSCLKYKKDRYLTKERY
jgi:5-methylcytosine-specific restriction endonuclease McrA